MIFLADRVVDISVLERKSFSMDCDCSAIESIIVNVIFMYWNECTVDIVLFLVSNSFALSLAYVHLLPLYVGTKVLYLLIYFKTNCRHGINFFNPSWCVGPVRLEVTSGSPSYPERGIS